MAFCSIADWVSQRDSLLSSLFYLLSTVFGLRYSVFGIRSSANFDYPEFSSLGELLGSEGPSFPVRSVKELGNIALYQLFFRGRIIDRSVKFSLFWVGLSPNWVAWLVKNNVNIFARDSFKNVIYPTLSPCQWGRQIIAVKPSDIRTFKRMWPKGSS